MSEKLTETDFLGMFEPGTPYADRLVTVTAEGQIVGYGHQAPETFLPAALHLFRAELEGEEEPAAVEVQHLWAIPQNYETPNCWGITTDKIQVDTPHAVAVTILEA